MRTGSVSLTIGPGHSVLAGKHPATGESYHVPLPVIRPGVRFGIRGGPRGFEAATLVELRGESLVRFSEGGGWVNYVIAEEVTLSLKGSLFEAADLLGVKLPSARAV